MQKKVAGLTLVELMVALAVLAILVTIGYPMYLDQVRKGRRVDAKSAVMLIARAQEDHDKLYRRYTESGATITGVTFSDGLPTPGLNSTFNDDVANYAAEFSDFYSFTITADADSYTITATPTGGQANDTDCVSFSKDSTGAHWALDSGSGDSTDLCW